MSHTPPDEGSISDSDESSTKSKKKDSSKHAHQFSKEETDILDQSFHRLTSEHKIDVTKVAVVIRALNSNLTDHALHSLITHTDVKEGFVDKNTYENIIAKAWGPDCKMDTLLEKVQTVKEGTGFYPALHDNFPHSLPESEFVEKVSSRLHHLGFSKNNTLTCACLCRDEICKPLLKILLRFWGETFEFSSLAGMLFMGRTGMSAALHHAPQSHGRERYLFFAFPHIAIDEFGKIGAIFRPGRSKQSSACGALCAFKGEYDSGHVNLGIDLDDVEYSLMKENLLKNMEYGAKPSLVDLTKLVQKVSLVDLERLIGKCVNTKIADYVVISGVQIHGPHWIKHKDMDYIYPAAMYTVINGQKEVLTL